MNFSSLWGIDVEEGQVGGEENDSEEISFHNLRWQVCARPAEEVIGAKKDEKACSSDARKSKTVKDNGSKMLNTYDALVKAGAHHEGWVTVRLCRDETKLSGETAGRAVNALVEEGILERAEMPAPTGRGLKGKKNTDSIRRKTSKDVYCV